MTTTTPVHAVQPQVATTEPENEPVSSPHRESPPNLQVQSSGETDASSADSSVMTQIFPPSGEGAVSMEDLLLLLSALSAETTEEQMKFAKEGIEIDRVNQEKRHEERMNQIQKAIDALEKADKSGLVGKVFGWLGAAAMVIAGAALIATGVGAAAGSLMLAGAAVMIASQISAETGDWMNEGLAEMFEAFGVPEEHSELAATIFVAVVVIALGVGSGVAGAVSPAASAATAAVKVAQAAQGVGGALAVGQGSAGAASATYTYEAAQANANSAEQQDFIQELILFMQDKNEKLRELIEDFKRGAQITSDSLASLHEAKSEIVMNTRI